MYKITLYQPTEPEIKQLLIIAGLAFNAATNGETKLLSDYISDKLPGDLWDFLYIQSPFLVETLTLIKPGD